MTYIIIVDMRENNGQILGMRHDEVSLAQFETEEEAEELMSKHHLNVFPYEILDMGKKLFHKETRIEITKQVIAEFKECWNDGSLINQDPHLRVLENWLDKEGE